MDQSTVDISMETDTNTTSALLNDKADDDDGSQDRVLEATSTALLTPPRTTELRMDDASDSQIDVQLIFDACEQHSIEGETTNHTDLNSELCDSNSNENQIDRDSDANTNHTDFDLELEDYSHSLFSEPDQMSNDGTKQRDMDSAMEKSNPSLEKLDTNCDDNSNDMDLDLELDESQSSLSRSSSSSSSSSSRASDSHRQLDISLINDNNANADNSNQIQSDLDHSVAQCSDEHQSSYNESTSNLEETISSSSDTSHSSTDSGPSSMESTQNLEESAPNSCEPANLDEVEAEHTESATDFTAPETPIDECNERYGIEPKASVNSSEPSSNEPEIILNEPEIISNEPEISSNEPDINSNEQEISSNEPEINLSEQQINSNETEIISNEPEINSNEQESSSNEQESNSNEQEISSNEPEISSNEKKIISNASDISSNETEIRSEREISLNESEINSIETEIDSNDSKTSSNEMQTSPNRPVANSNESLVILNELEDSLNKLHTDLSEPEVLPNESGVVLNEVDSNELVSTQNHLVSNLDEPMEITYESYTGTPNDSEHVEYKPQTDNSNGPVTTYGDQVKSCDAENLATMETNLIESIETIDDSSNHSHLNLVPDEPHSNSDENICRSRSQTPSDSNESNSDSDDDSSDGDLVMDEQLDYHTDDNTNPSNLDTASNEMPPALHTNDDSTHSDVQLVVDDAVQIENDDTSHSADSDSTDYGALVINEGSVDSMADTTKDGQAAGGSNSRKSSTTGKLETNILKKRLERTTSLTDLRTANINGDVDKMHELPLHRKLKRKLSDPPATCTEKQRKLNDAESHVQIVPANSFSVKINNNTHDKILDYVNCDTNIPIDKNIGSRNNLGNAEFSSEPSIKDNIAEKSIESSTQLIKPLEQSIMKYDGLSVREKTQPHTPMLHVADMKQFLKQQLLFGNVSEGYLNDYAQFLGLQPAVKFQCFKCDANQFTSLAELKSHHLICLRSSNANSKSDPINGKSCLSNKLIANLNGASVNSATTTTTDQSSTTESIQTSDTTKVAMFNSDTQNPQQQIQSNHFNAHIRIRRQVFLCSACGTYYEKWNLFYHIREVHKKFICLFCLGIFPSAERLVSHLEGKHINKPNVYDHKDELIKSLREQCYLMCCVCEHIFSEADDFTGHSCEHFMKPCTQCGLKFIHKNNCTLASKSKTKQKVKKSVTEPPTATNAPKPNVLSAEQRFIKISKNHDGTHNLTSLTKNNHSNTPTVTKAVEQLDEPATITSPKQSNGNGFNFDPYHHSKIINNHILDEKLKQIYSQSNSNNASSNVPKENGGSVHYDRSSDHENSEVNANSSDNINEDDDEDDDNDNDSDIENNENSQTADENKLNNLNRTVKPLKLSLIDRRNNNANNLNSPDLTNQWRTINKLNTYTSAALESQSTKADNIMNKAADLEYYRDQTTDNTTACTVPEERTEATMKPNEPQVQNYANAEKSFPQNHVNNGSYDSYDTVNNMDREEKPLMVPKLKLKISKEFKPTIESEESSTETDDENNDDGDDDDEEAEDEENASSESEEEEEQVEHVNQVAQTADTVQDAPVVESAHCDETDQHIQSITDYDEADMNITPPVETSKNIETAISTQQLMEISVDEQPTINDDTPMETGTETDTPQSEPIAETKEPEPKPEPEPEPEHTTTPIDEPLVSADTGILEASESLPQEMEISENSAEVNDAPNENVPETDIQPIPEAVEEIKPATETHPEKEPKEQHNEQPKEQPEEEVVEEEVEDNRSFTEFVLDQPLDKISNKDFIRKCLKSSIPLCLYCNHARKIAVSGVTLAEHLLQNHRFSATVDSITAEELPPKTIDQKIKASIPELEGTYFNLDSFDYKSEDYEYVYKKDFECFQCRFKSFIYKDLYLHNRKMHLRAPIICLMCKANFLSYTELVCHICPGSQQNLIPIDLKFRCVLCNLQDIPSAFRLMVHLRKKHSACDVCLEECQDQSKLSSHVWKHKLHHLCYRCNIMYRNKADITKHLFWKHGTESVLCKRCLEKKWPHVYHFCVPPNTFTCEICSLTLSRAVALKVHRRLHNENAVSYPCTEDNCEKKFISRKLLLKHVARHYAPPPSPPREEKPFFEGLVDDVIMANKTKTPAPSRPTSPSAEVTMPTLAPVSEEPSNVDETMEMDKDIEENRTVTEEEKKPTEMEEKVETAKKEKAGEAKEEKHQKHKHKKLKKHKSDNLSDLINLPTPNLSESDSSDDSDNESAQHNITNSADNSLHSFANPFEHVTANDNETGNKTAVTDIWENFRSYHASQMQDKSLSEIDDEKLASAKPDILHVSQSDHDYCCMYKPGMKTNNTVQQISEQPNVMPLIEKDDDGEIKITFVEIPVAALPPPSPESTEKEDQTKVESNVDKKPDTAEEKSEKTKARPDSESSSGNSSDSSSSCSCGSNCSCSSSSDSSSSSSSDSDSDSSSSEGRRKQMQKKAAKLKKQTKIPSPVKESNEEISVKPELDDKLIKNETEHMDIDVGKNEGDVVDVITTDIKPLPTPDPDSIILESDLETAESETDEDFYDENPQKLANQILAEKRQQLLQTCYNSMNSTDIVENSRPSTPSLPEEVAKEQKVRARRKKKVRRTSKNTLSPRKQTAARLLYQQQSTTSYQQQQVVPYQQQSLPYQPPVTHYQQQVVPYQPPAMPYQHPSVAVNYQQQLIPYPQQTVPYQQFHQLVVAQQQQQNQLQQQSQHVLYQLQQHHIQQQQHLQQQFQQQRAISSQVSQPVTIPSQPCQILQSAAVVSLPHPPTIPVTNSVTQNISLAGKITSDISRLSTGSSCSEADSSLKRSKRRRIPNKFYGYTSENDTYSSLLNANVNSQNPFKPTPPPNLVWSKEDLPATPKTSKVAKTPKSAKTGPIITTIRLSNLPGVKSKQCKTPAKIPKLKIKTKMAPAATPKSAVVTPNSEPVIPPIIIRPTGVVQQQMLPPRVLPQNEISETLKVPALPVHHIVPPMRLLKQDSEHSSSDSDSDSSDEGALKINQSGKSTPLQSFPAETSQPKPGWSSSITKPDLQQQQQQQQQPKLPFFNNQPLDPNLINKPNQIRYPIRPPAACRSVPREGESVYCYCRCPYDEINEMIACDATNCPIEWFHFECVGIVVAPQDKWYCPQCRPQYVSKEDMAKYANPQPQPLNYPNSQLNHYTSGVGGASATGGQQQIQETSINSTALEQAKQQPPSHLATSHSFQNHLLSSDPSYPSPSVT